MNTFTLRFSYAPTSVFWGSNSVGNTPNGGFAPFERTNFRWTTSTVRQYTIWAGFPIYMKWKTIHPPASQQVGEIRARTLVIRGEKGSPTYSALAEESPQV